MEPTNNVWWMRCLFNVHGSQMVVIFWMLVVKTWTAFAQLPAKIHETDLLRAPTNVPLQQHFPSIWNQQTMFDGWDAYSMSTGARQGCFSRLAILRWWKEHKNFCKTKLKSMRQTFCMPHPMSLYHSVSRPYGPNKQCLMDEMPIQCPWEPDGVDFLNVGCKHL
jgi:hypothetical protein